MQKLLASKWQRKPLSFRRQFHASRLGYDLPTERTPLSGHHADEFRANVMFYTARIEMPTLYINQYQLCAVLYLLN